MGTNWNAFRQRLENGKFSDSDFENIANALGAEYHSSFTIRTEQKFKLLFRKAAFILQNKYKRNCNNTEKAVDKYISSAIIPDFGSYFLVGLSITVINTVEISW